MDGTTLVIFAAVGAGLAVWARRALIAPRGFRARLVRGNLDVERATEAADVDEATRRIVDTVEELGYQTLAALRSGNGAVSVILHSEVDGSIAEVVDMRTTKGVGRFIVELTTVLQRGQALMCTADTVAVALHEDELRQAFPDASPADLARCHDEALAHLRDAGVAVERVAADEALAVRRQWISKHRRWVERAPVRIVRAWMRGTRNGSLVCAGPITGSRVMQARISALLQFN